MEDSDFSYEDTGASDTFIEDFSSKKLGSEQKEGYEPPPLYWTPG